MDTLTRAQIVWTETKDLQVPDGGDPATLSALRRHVAAIASEAERAFSRFEAIPARDDPLYGRDVIDCAKAAEGATEAAFKNIRVIVWPSADGKTLNKDELNPPSPWDMAAPESLGLIGRYKVDGKDISAFSRSLVAGEDAPRFVSLVTGTGLPPDTNVYAPRSTGRRPVDPRTSRNAFWLAMATLVLFAIACIWTVSVGSLTRSAQNIFMASVGGPSTCPTAIDPGNTATLFGAPQQWLPTATGPSECMTKWNEAIAKALAADGGDWWSSLQSWLAGLTVADAGQAMSLRMPILLMMASLVLLAIAVGLGVLGRVLGLFIDKRNRMSLTRIQSAVWLVILVGGLAATALYNVGFWAEDLNRIRGGLAYLADAGTDRTLTVKWSDTLSSLADYVPKMDAALWALIGIAGGTTILSSFIMQPGAPAVPDGKARPMMPARRTSVLANKDPKDARLSDLVFGETVEDEGVVDSTRVQAVAVTGVLAAIYFNLVLGAGEAIGGLTAVEAVRSGAQIFSDMPPVGATFLTLLAVSHGALLGGKLFGAYGK